MAAQQHKEYWSAQPQILSKLFELTLGKKISKNILSQVWEESGGKKKKSREMHFKFLGVGNSYWYHMPGWHGCWALDRKKAVTGRMEKGNWRILKMKMSSLRLVLGKRLPEEESAIATVPKMAKVAGCTNTAFAAILEQVISYIKTESIGVFIYFFLISMI